MDNKKINIGKNIIAKYKEYGGGKVLIEINVF